MENKNEINIKEAYRAKLTKGWRELVDGSSLDEKIVEKIKKTAAAAACYQSLMSEEDEDYMLYLLRFKDPLGIVADGYLATLEMAVEEDLYQIVNDLMDAPGTDFKYPLDPEWAEKDVLLLLAFREKMEQNWQDYLASLDGLPMAGLARRLGEINATRICYEAMRDIWPDQEIVRELNRYADPLALLRDIWLENGRAANMEYTRENLCWIAGSLDEISGRYELDKNAKGGLS